MLLTSCHQAVYLILQGTDSHQLFIYAFTSITHSRRSESVDVAVNFEGPLRSHDGPGTICLEKARFSGGVGGMESFAGAVDDLLGVSGGRACICIVRG